MKRTFTGVAGAIFVLLTAACGSTAGGSGTVGSSPTATTASPKTSTPAPATNADLPPWTNGGTLTGPWPPAAGPHSPARWGKPHTFWAILPEGYKYLITVRFGPALHYKMSQTMYECGRSSYRQDLPPGQYEIPFMIEEVNKTGQDAPAVYPEFGSDIGDVTLAISSSSALTDGHGNCFEKLGGGYTEFDNVSQLMFGVLGPTTGANFQAATISIRFGSWRGPDNPQLVHRVATLTPKNALPAS